ncbi:hypothetical protein B0T25DRAFT_260027 [Lasiosphaeria hispida]|uniref:Uncharacterized protein n=1 Tax=Lasiosphaeria hispida TaxID=260671 RepID=A0AAJ0MCZ2_9PEZI|nr:hypothetical protein B0T25DRAFT_260027 [Lasiosphaeria hispida]
MRPTDTVADGGMSPRQGVGEEGAGTGKRKRKRGNSEIGGSTEKKGRMGRPPNPPRPGPLPTPVYIAPRLGSPVAPSLPRPEGGPANGLPPENLDVPINPAPPPTEDTSTRPTTSLARPSFQSPASRGLQRMDQNPLRRGEHMTRIIFPGAHDRVIGCSSAIISPEYPTSMPIRMVRELGIAAQMKPLERTEKRSYFTPRGTMRFRRSVGLYIQLDDPVYLPPTPVNFRVLESEDEDLGVAAIIGGEFIEYCRSALWTDWPLRNYELERNCELERNYEHECNYERELGLEYVCRPFIALESAFVDPINPVELTGNVPVDMVEAMPDHSI